MKDNNKFLVWSKAFAFQRQTLVTFCFWCFILCGVLLAGILLADLLRFDMAYLPIPLMVGVGICSRISSGYFYQERFLIPQQLKYLYRCKKEQNLDAYKNYVDTTSECTDEWRLADNYQEVTAAIAELAERQAVLAAQYMS